MALPHIKNSKAGINREEPWYGNLFEVYFSIPEALQAETGADDVNVLTEQVTKVDGLGTLLKSPGVKDQKFMGTTRSYLDSMVDETAHDITITMNLNMRNGIDNYIFKLFRNWASLGYDLATGQRVLKNDYVADFIRIVAFNRAGDIFKDITYHDIMLVEVTGLDSFDYSTSDLLSLTVKFRSDWADDVDA